MGLFISFIFIIAILLAWKVLIKEVSQYLEVVKQLTMMDSATASIQEFRIELQRKSSSLKGKSATAIDEELKKNSTETEIQSAKLRARSSIWRLPFPSVESATIESKIWLLKQEREYLEKLQETIKETADLGSRRQKLNETFVAVNANDAQQKKLKVDYPNQHIYPMTYSYNELEKLTRERSLLMQQNAAANQRFQEKDKKLKAINAEVLGLETSRANSSSIPEPLDTAFKKLNTEWGKSWLSKIIGPVLEVAPVAARLLLFAIAVPVGVKLLFYYFLAPIASRRPAIGLIPDEVGVNNEADKTLAERHPTRKISAVSKTIEIEAGREILIHSEYLQSSTENSKKDTKWLLNNSYWWSSILAGMVLLTRFRTERNASITVSAGSQDAISEVGTIELPAGAAIALKPRFLVGVVSPSSSPLRITRHWRLTSLHAWLTLQLRFLVFHGPATLIVKGGRGIQLEPAHAGRSLNRDLTMGFSSNLQYSTTRCETFMAYLRGKQSLLNDQFSGDRGFCIYEQHASGKGKAGSGRGSLEGIVDSALNVFGI